MTTQIPLLDLSFQYEPIKEEIFEIFKGVYESKRFILGPEVEKFEASAATYCGAKHAIGVTSGSDALIISLMALGIGHGDEVITTPFTFFATIGSIVRVGATPVFVDIDPNTFNIDPALIEASITEKTKAIMPVHLFGQMADMDPICAIAKKHNLEIIEDSAQAIGASYHSDDGKTYKSGSMGTLGCFSFFPSKNLGCLGDGGMVTTNDPTLYKKLKSLRMHGETERYHHQYVGGNFRIDALQAAFLSLKLPLLDEQHQLRLENAEAYNSSLKTVKVPFIHKKAETIYNQYTIQVANREKFQAYLNEKKIGNAIYYPVPMHLQECFSNLGHKNGDFPITEAAAKSVLSIPVFGGLTESQRNIVIETINAFS
jgi:dTDP-4-amino-4,6-dideoxygalactose transaminase